VKVVRLKMTSDDRKSAEVTLNCVTRDTMTVCKAVVGLHM